MTSKDWHPASMSAQLPTCSAAMETGHRGPSLELGHQAGRLWGMGQARTWALPVEKGDRNKAAKMWAKAPSYMKLVPEIFKGLENVRSRGTL